MGRIDLRTVQERKSAGLGSDDLTRIEPGKITTSNQAKQSQQGRGVRKDQILAFVEQNPGATRTQIARGIGMKKAGHFVSLVDGLVSVGLLIRWCEVTSNGLEVWKYEAVEL